MLSEIAGRVPEHWAIRTIESVCSRVTSGGTPSRRQKSYYTGSIPWVKTQELQDVWIDDTEEHITEDAVTESSAKLLARNTVLLALYGATVGKLGLLRRPMTCNQACCAIEVDPGEADFRYLYYQLLHHREQLKSAATGAAQQNLSGTLMKSFELPFPPLPEQRAIAGVLGSLDDKIELNRRMNRTLESMARALFRHRFLDHPDPAWEEKSLDEVADFLNGLACQKFPPAEGEPTLPVLKIAQLRKGDTGGGDRCNTEVPDKYVVNDGDVIFSWSGSLLVRLWTGGEAVLNQHLFKVTSDTTPRWFHYLWTCHHLDSFQQTAASKATTMGHIKRHHLTDAKVLLPTPTELDVIGETIEPLLARCLSNELESRTLFTLRDALLPKLLGGELSVVADQF